MKTSTAQLVHSALGLSQAGALAVPGVPVWEQILIQVGLTALQAFAAWLNSRTDQNGNPLPPQPADKGGKA
jgi:hypothetical protein